MRALHAFDRPGWGDLDLTMSQLKTIMLLVETGGLSGRDLAERLGIGPSAVTALVDRLVQRGYARREEDRADRRVSWARPTEQGDRAVRASPRDPSRAAGRGAGDTDS